MKPYLKLFTLAVVSLIMFSCNKDEDDPAPAQSESLENAKLSFDAMTPPVQLPSKMRESDDFHALLAVGYVDQANGMTSWISNLDFPDGAAKSSTPIGGRTSSGGRIAKTEAEVLVYTWTDGSTSIAYQVSETDEKYKFELFWKLEADGEFIRVLNAEEFKSRREGFMEWSLGAIDEDFVFRYEWREDADGTFHFDMFTSDNSFLINIVSNTDNSGSVKYIIEGDLLYLISWNADGSGSWVLYNDDGTENSSGIWSN